MCTLWGIETQSQKQLEYACSSFAAVLFSAEAQPEPSTISRFLHLSFHLLSAESPPSIHSLHQETVPHFVHLTPLDPLTCPRLLLPLPFSLSLWECECWQLAGRDRVLMLGLKVTAPVLQPHCWGAADPSPPWHAWSGTERARVREAQGGWMGVERQECEEEKRPGEKKKRITTLPFCSGFAIQKKSASTRRRRKKKSKKMWRSVVEHDWTRAVTMFFIYIHHQSPVVPQHPHLAQCGQVQSSISCSSPKPVGSFLSISGLIFKFQLWQTMMTPHAYVFHGSFLWLLLWYVQSKSQKVCLSYLFHANYFSF